LLNTPHAALGPGSFKSGIIGYNVLDIDDVQRKRIIFTRLRGSVTVREENAVAALEVMSRFATDPRWLIYLPPTMSPSDTRKDGPTLEHPEESFHYFRANGVPRVVCQEKHMGSRAIAVVCRDEDVPAKRFGIRGHGIGALYTRTGRPFFDDPALESALLDRLRAALTNADFWKKFESDWFCLDAELIPWSAKAQEWLRSQYAPVGAASRASMAAALPALRLAASRVAEVIRLVERYAARQECVEKYTDAYRRYCWPVSSIEDLRFAPFHVLASEGRRSTRWRSTSRDYAREGLGRSAPWLFTNSLSGSRRCIASSNGNRFIGCMCPLDVQQRLLSQKPLRQDRAAEQRMPALPNLACRPGLGQRLIHVQHEVV